MVKGRSIPEGQELPEEKNGPEHAGEVFAEVYATAVKNMHPEDAVSVAEDAALNFLDSIGAARPSTEYVDEGMRVKVVNSRELAGEIVKVLYGGEIAAPQHAYDDAVRAYYSAVQKYGRNSEEATDAARVVSEAHYALTGQPADLSVAPSSEPQGGGEAV